MFDLEQKKMICCRMKLSTNNIIRKLCFHIESCDRLNCPRNFHPLFLQVLRGCEPFEICRFHVRCHEPPFERPKSELSLLCLEDVDGFIFNDIPFLNNACTNKFSYI